jgi:hypothetical protein
MADKYLDDSQQAQLMEMLNSQQPAPEEGIPQGGEPAPADANGEAAPASPAPADAAAPEATPAPDPVQALLSELGVSSPEELVERYRDRESKATEYRDMLTQLLAYQQALDNEDELDTTDPLDSVKKAVREEIKPLYDKLQADARNKVVQDAWNKDAKDMPDIADVMPEIAQFIADHPDLAVSDDGLRRAYDSVRSKKYRTEAQMLADDEFVKRMAANDKIKEAVLQNHLGELARSGEAVPNSIGSGGNIPLTGQKKAPDSMSQAKSGLAKMLGLK